MNKADLVDVTAREAGTTKKLAEKVITATTNAIIRHAALGQRVTLVGFGTFEVRQRKGRSGRNPQTGEELIIPAKKVAAFKAGEWFSLSVERKS